MKVQLNNDVTTIKSSIKFKDLQVIEKQEPRVLTLRDEKGNEVFKISTGKEGSLSKYGVTFDREAEDGKAYVSIKMEDNVTKQYIKENSGYILAKLSKFEKHLSEHITKLNEELEGLFDD